MIAQERFLAATTSSQSTSLGGALPPHYNRNALAFIADYACFLFAMGFIGTGTVMPALIAMLTPRSEIYVGLLNGLVSGLWLLPQLAIAGAVTRPGQMGADESRLTRILADATHARKLNLPREDWERIFIWLDGNVPFYGTYDKDQQQQQQAGAAVSPPAIQ